MTTDDPYRTRPRPLPDPHPYAGPPPPVPPPARSASRRPSWPALFATALGAALLASGATAVVTEARDDEPAAALTSVPGDQREAAAADDAPTAPTASGAPDWVTLAERVGPTVVAIDVRTAQGAGAGSGVIVSDDGRIITNHHVVGGAVRGGIQVTLSDGRMFAASVVGTDPPTDLAVVTLDDPPEDLVVAALGDSDAVRVGDPVAAIGNPLGLSHTVTTGIVSALDRPVTTSQAPQAPGQRAVAATTNAIQVDAPINPGNSGGPLFDASGRVIGINSSIASMPTGAGGTGGSIGLGFAIPSNLVELIGGQLIENGVAEHAYLGVVPVDAVTTAEDETRSGAGVDSVEPGTPAEAAGLRPGDVVIRVDDEYVTGAESLIGVIREHASGDQVELTVVRGGTPQRLTATLATREDQLG